VRGFDSPSGKGAIGMVERRRVALGNARFLGELSIATQPLESEAEKMRGEFVASAVAARSEAITSGKGIGASDVHAYLRDRASGKRPAKPRAKPWRR